MNKDDLIANYFLGNLTQEEQLKFEQLMHRDSDFKKEVEFQQDVKDTIFRGERQKLKHQLQGVERSITFEKANKLRWLVAAVIIVSITIGYAVLNPSYTHNELYAMYFEPAQNIIHPIVRESVADNDEAKAFIAYQKKDYKLAAQLFGAEFLDSNTSEILFYEAICLMELNKVDQAIEKFETHKKYTDLLSNKTNWYLALAYIKQNNIVKAKDILNLIIDNQESYNFKKAKELLKKL